MKIRRADINDLDYISLLWVDMVLEEHGDNFSPSASTWRDMVRHKMISNQHFIALVAEDQERITGFIMGETFLEPGDQKIHGHSQCIYVVPHYRKQSVGLLLYHTLAKAFIRDGAQVIGFNCVPEKIKFWEAKGYHPAGVIMEREARNLVKAFSGDND